ncbi:MAG: hypothetical protein LBC26_03455 [Oscillospiraceae bacterium]|jgi:hypothetical protein|nr:hypothetical protein [Oscillospiraceae bacterium]
MQEKKFDRPRGAGEKLVFDNFVPIVDNRGAAQTMPQKSTYFDPKLTTGLVIHPLSIDL